MQAKFNLPSPIQKIQLPALGNKSIECFVKRDDLIDAVISGNKWRKLKYNIDTALEKNSHSILTFGGAFSNHIAATAEACKRFGIPSIGIIRGEELNAESNATLKRASKQGMKLLFVSREEYKKRNDELYLENLKNKYKGAFIIPEGGANELGVIGCTKIYDELDSDFDSICISAGTGTTAAGLLRSIKKERLIVIPALKGSFLKEEIQRLAKVKREDNLLYIDEYHFGGYAKSDTKLITFMKEFQKLNGFELDKIYTSKLFFGINSMISEGFFPDNSRILLVHTGGLQGN